MENGQIISYICILVMYFTVKEFLIETNNLLQTIRLLHKISKRSRYLGVKCISTNLNETFTISCLSLSFGKSHS